MTSLLITDSLHDATTYLKAMGCFWSEELLCNGTYCLHTVCVWYVLAEVKIEHFDQKAKLSFIN